MIRVEDLNISQGKFRLEDINLNVEKGKYIVMMGKTGCGKTTLLEAICGLRSVNSGKILLNNRDITQLKPAERGIGYVPQDGALFSTMTVFENMGFALKIRKWSKSNIKTRVEELGALLGINHLLNRNIYGLSGGERQRIALGRALSFKPEILCLDEPLSALDETTRYEMYDLINVLKEKTEITALHVSHSSTEAERLADDVFVFEDGKLVSNSPRRS
jgi:ABC-type sugar transport system ATPase subunit